LVYKNDIKETRVEIIFFATETKNIDITMLLSSIISAITAGIVTLIVNKIERKRKELQDKIPKFDLHPYKYSERNYLRVVNLQNAPVFNLSIKIYKEDEETTENYIKRDKLKLEANEDFSINLDKWPESKIELIVEIKCKTKGDKEHTLIRHIELE